MTNSSLVLLSGGLDSVLALKLAQENTHVQFALTFDYGQQAAKREIEASQKICALEGIRHEIVALPFFKKVLNHPFFAADTVLPQLQINELDNNELTKKSAAAVWVPNRNGLFINLAATLAEAENINFIYTGFNAEEAKTFPDNSADFIKAINHALSYSTESKVEVVSPTIQLHKTAIIQELIKRDFPLNIIWSCYSKKNKMCGLCESCQRFKRALICNDLQDLLTEIFLH